MNEYEKYLAQMRSMQNELLMGRTYTSNALYGGLTGITNPFANNRPEPLSSASNTNDKKLLLLEDI